MGGELFRNAVDPGELPVPAILLDREAETLTQVPGERIAVNRARRLRPTIDRVLVKRPPLAVLLRPRGIEDHAVGVELGIVVPAGAVLEHGRRDVGGQHLDPPVCVADAGPAAMAEHRLFQRNPGRVVVRLFDLTAQARIGDGPQRGNALVGGERHVEAGRAPFAAGVPGQLARPVRGDAVIEAVELAAVDLAAILQAEQVRGIEPHPVRLLSRRVVFVGVAE